MPRLSLRARLLLGVLVLATVGLVAADAVTYTSLRSFLLDRVDSTLDADHQGASRARFGPGGGPPGGGPRAFGSDHVQWRPGNRTQGIPTHPRRPPRRRSCRRRSRSRSPRAEASTG